MEARGESQAAASAKLAQWLAGGERGVAITGASGWVGRAMAQAALEAGCTRLRLFGSRTGTVAVAGRSLPLELLGAAAALGGGEWLVLHLAVAGADRYPDPQECRVVNEAMLADTLKLAGTSLVRRLVAASSGAVYAPPQPSPQKQAYADLKRDQEQIVQAWARKTGVPILLPRIFNLGGPYMTHPDRYALGSLIRQTQAGGAMRIEARRPVIRSYVHVLELAQATYELALGEAAWLAFDTAGAEVVELADLARAVGRALVQDIRIERAPPDGEHEDRYVGDGAIYRAALAGQPISLDAIIRDTASWLGA